MRKTIRLTESELKDVVMEALDELDWRTYANAATGRARQAAGGERFNRHGRVNNQLSGDLAAMAGDRLNQKYSGGEGHPHCDLELTYNGDGRQDGPRWHAYTRTDNGRSYIDGSGAESGGHERPPMDGEVASYIGGRSSYGKGRGWRDADGGTLDEAVSRAVRRYLLREDVDTGQVPSAQDREDAASGRMSFDSRPEIQAARKELRRLRNMIDTVEGEGGDIGPIRMAIRNINDHYFNGDYLWHLGRGDEWVDHKGWVGKDSGR